jgi:hypothetical protein
MVTRARSFLRDCGAGTTARPLPVVVRICRIVVARCYRVERHIGDRGVVDMLRDGDAASAFDELETVSPVIQAARQHDADDAGTVLLRRGAK